MIFMFEGCMLCVFDVFLDVCVKFFFEVFMGVLLEVVFMFMGCDYLGK